MNLTRATACAAVLLLIVSCCRTRTPNAGDGDYPSWMPTVGDPAIPARTVCVTDFGGVGDGLTLNTEAFRLAIAALSEQGGGRVTVPAGVWYTGPVVLTDNIELHLERNALLLFSDDKSLYPLVETTFEGLETWRCQSPISATHARNVANVGRRPERLDVGGDARRLRAHAGFPAPGDGCDPSLRERVARRGHVPELALLEPPPGNVHESDRA